MENEMNGRTVEVRVADVCLKTVAAIAATDIKGVYSLKGDLTRDNIPTAAPRMISEAVQLERTDDTVQVTISVVLDGTVTIPEVVDKTTKKVTDAVELMTGADVTKVVVNVTGVKA